MRKLYILLDNSPVVYGTGSGSNVIAVCEGEEEYKMKHMSFLPEAEKYIKTLISEEYKLIEERKEKCRVNELEPNDPILDTYWAWEQAEKIYIETLEKASWEDKVNQYLEHELLLSWQLKII